MLSVDEFAVLVKLSVAVLVLVLVASVVSAAAVLVAVLPLYEERLVTLEITELISINFTSFCC